MNINEAKVIVTGATGGIGYETAKALRSLGAEVVICGRDTEKVIKAADELNVYGIVADVSNETEIANLFSFAMQKMGAVSVLINNAGIGRFASLTDTTEEDFQQAWETNVKGLFLAGKEAAKHFIAQKHGNIINIGSTASLRGYANGSAYVASKFAVSGLTECWRAELRPHNIRVMQINPSEVITDFIAKAGMEVQNEERKLKASDVAHVVVTMLGMNDVGFIPDASVWATNPW
ncbi:SDR family oxidoreductase [Mucilaginibacter sp. JRF]|uniref:SDR family oxidoreductase n=1 Tax=Mucilaginibacter sp. JRF TaxID=2780088 RepID=UPI0018827489|nr:SDR family oxidoreductase [Mucilaginibacter sp. JRF]MBE9583316.1 SDR family oxidoreductase [Mucilaginibacter sp. JRF]